MNDLTAPNTTPDERTRDRILGSLLGGAVGDAMGEPIEFMSFSEIRRLIGPNGLTGYWERSYPGAFSDDTQMTLWTAEGLIRAWQAHCAGLAWDPVATTARAYMRWFLTQGEVYVGAEHDDAQLRTGWLFDVKGLWQRRAPGNTCLSALRVGGNLDLSRPINDSKGCGGVMRIAPVGLIGPSNDSMPFVLGCMLAGITHSHPTGYVAAGFLAQIIAGIKDGLTLRDALRVAIENAGDMARANPGYAETLTALEGALALAASGPPTPERVERLGGGWTAEEALAIGVYAALVSDDFRSGVLLAVNHSGDSDSTGSIAGQILGAIHGVDGIPQEWLDSLRLREVVEQVGGDLFDAYYQQHRFGTDAYPEH